jgi:hypothetical protein
MMRSVMRRPPAFAIACLLILWLSPARAHVAPAVRENNRYIKLIPLGDQVRLAYTIYYGEIPGQAMRKSMDKDNDGTVSEEEAQVFSNQIAAHVADKLRVTVDDALLAVEWEQVYVGLESRSTSDGAFTVDLVAWLCLDRPKVRTAHAVSLVDETNLDNPGEIGIRVDQSPGIRITSAPAPPEGEAVDGDNAEVLWPEGETHWPYSLAFEVDPKSALFAPSVQCVRKPAPGSAPLPDHASDGGQDHNGVALTPTNLTAFAVLGVIVAGLALFAWRQRRQRMKG